MTIYFLLHQRKFIHISELVILIDKFSVSDLDMDTAHPAGLVFGCALFCYWMSHLIAVDHDDVITWKHFPRYWPFVRWIHRSPVNSPHKGQWRGALIFSLICAWINGWVNNRKASDLRRHHAHNDVTAMWQKCFRFLTPTDGSAITYFQCTFFENIIDLSCCYRTLFYRIYISN